MAWIDDAASIARATAHGHEMPAGRRQQAGSMRSKLAGHLGIA